VVGFGKFIGNAILAPVAMVAPHFYHLLLDRLIKPAPALGHPTSKLVKRGIATTPKAWLPILEGRAAHISAAAGKVTITGRLPGLKQQSALLRRSQRKIDALLSHQVLRFAEPRMVRV
jgi:hypothetical protein